MSELNFLIKPCSYLCNLNCSYCFYRRISSLYPDPKPVMDAPTAEVFIRKALSSGASQVSFCWQGGEPMLAGLAFYRTIAAFQEKYRRPGQVIMNSLQTNGLLLDQSWAEFLRQHQFLVGISLDGPRDMHDAYRMTTAGQGTYSRVMDKIRLLNNEGVPFNILTLLTRANIEKPDNLYAFFRGQAFNHLQFIPCLEWSLETGAPSPFSINGPELGRFYIRLLELWLKDGFPYVSIRLFEDVLMYLLDGSPQSCTWLDRCSSYLLVEYNGDCYPCDFFVQPEWKLGNLATGSLVEILNLPLRREFAALKSKTASQCPSCRHFGFCHGDCLKFRLGSSGDSGSLSCLCQGWLMFLDHVQAHQRNLKEKALEARQAHARQSAKNPGRNDPCPCGSGKKFKRCCAL